MTIDGRTDTVSFCYSCFLLSFDFFQVQHESIEEHATTNLILEERTKTNLILEEHEPVEECGSCKWVQCVKNSYAYV